jgi:hypothetical protein
MDWVVVPVDHVLPVACEDVSVAEEPGQRLIGPAGEIVGAAGNGFTVITTGAEVAEHPPPVVYVTV